LLSLACKTEQLDPTMLDQSLFKHDCGVHLLASGEPFSDWRLIRPELVHKVAGPLVFMLAGVVVATGYAIVVCAGLVIRRSL
jgi:hypothetical protein